MRSRGCEPAAALCCCHHGAYRVYVQVTAFPSIETFVEFADANAIKVRELKYAYGMN